LSLSYIMALNGDQTEQDRLAPEGPKQKRQEILCVQQGAIPSGFVTGNTSTLTPPQFSFGKMDSVDTICQIVYA